MNPRTALKALIALLLLIGGYTPTAANIEPTKGIQNNAPAVHVFVGADLVVRPGDRVSGGTLLIRDGFIVAAGKDVRIPADAEVHDVDGMTIYPGLIDMGASFGLREESDDTTGASHWNGAVRPDRDVAALFEGDEDVEKKYRKAGFTSAVIAPGHGIFRGLSALVSLADGDPSARILAPAISSVVTLERQKRGRYPDSQMGAIALTRQTFIDAAWYRDALAAHAARPEGQQRPDQNLALAALAPVLSGETPVQWHVTDEWEAIRVARVSREAGADFLIAGSGFEYRRLDAIRDLGVPVIAPVAFPETPELGPLPEAHSCLPLTSNGPSHEGGRSWGGGGRQATETLSSADESHYFTLRDLRHFVLAPENPGRLAAAGIELALTARGLSDPSGFRAKVVMAIDHGLSPEAALAAVTTVPAKLIGQSEIRGALGNGMAADFLVVEGELFEENAKVRESWIGGKKHHVERAPLFDAAGIWAVNTAANHSFDLEIQGEEGREKAKINVGDGIDISHFTIDRLSFHGSFRGDSIGAPGFVRIDGAKHPEGIAGHITLPAGRRIAWKGKWKAATEEKEAQEPGKPERPILPEVFPSGAFGFTTQPEQPDAILVKNATIWTCGPRGTITGADLLVRRGKIEQVARLIDAPSGAQVIDGTGLHVTPGLIDCHSHTGISKGVNEGTQAVTSEVRISDVIDPDHMGIYWQIAGGLTAANQLHGSANPIGGQNSVIKLRWGATDDQMRFDGAPQGIKFALGENVKQSNWGDKHTTRYPQTRMGVEEIIRDRFGAALEYRRAFEKFKSAPKYAIPPRRDLELEALAEIIEGKRLIHCHSYRQDEILMLIRVAEDFGFTIGTFQHVLEGYKVAEAIAEHGAGASSFSDWWAYKYEVVDAIPYNGALMHEVGVVVSFNSDSHQLARRLNLEAAKAVKYGGVPEEEALAFVTINPAKQLHIDERVGSLEPGKDADFVLWSAPPLSTRARCLQTWIDGKKYFDIEEDTRLRKEAADQREQIVQYVFEREAAKPKNQGRWRGDEEHEEEAQR